jgi:hypothetical protein|tara:strand:- start:1674 stop:1916 length:243 start_codon:yes stop_codon:yes gene_type:complete
MKKILFITTIVSFLSININVQAADCSNYKTFSHKWNMCKVGKLPAAASSAEGGTVEKKSKVKGLWNKIRTFGGSEVGSEG